MGGMLMAIVPIISGLMGGATPVAVLGGLSLTQWAALAGGILNLEGPDIEAALKKNPEIIGIVNALRTNPVLQKLITEVKTVGVQNASLNAHYAAWENLSKVTGQPMIDYPAPTREQIREAMPGWPG